MALREDGVIAVSSISSLLFGALIGSLFGVILMLVCVRRRWGKNLPSSESPVSPPSDTPEDSAASMTASAEYEEILSRPPPLFPRGQVEGLETNQNVAYGQVAGTTL